MARTVRLELTLAEARQLSAFANEGEVADSDAVNDGVSHPSSHAAGCRATGKLARAIHEAEGRRK